MNSAFSGEALSLVISVAGNFSIAGFFLSPASGSIRHGLPADYGMIIFVLEFLNVHSTAVAWSVQKSGYQIGTSIEFLRKNPKLLLVGFYLLGAITAGFALKSWILPAYFTVGLMAKFFGNRKAHDDLSVAYLILLLMFSFMLGMRIWPGILFFLFIWSMGLIFVAYPSFPLWRGWVAKRMEALKSRPGLSDPKRQLFRDKLDFLRYSMPLIIFMPFYLASWASNSPLPGENFWALLYFPSLAVNDFAVFLRSKFWQESLPDGPINYHV